MEPTIRHLPLIDHASGIQNLDQQAHRAGGGTRIEIWIAAMAVAIAFTAGLLAGIFINH